MLAQQRRAAAYAQPITHRDAVAVIGPGTMGRGYARRIAYKGHKVVLLSHTQQSAEQGLDRICKTVDFNLGRGTLGQLSHRRARSLIIPTDDYDRIKAENCRIVIECGPEVLEEKDRIFGLLDLVFPESDNGPMYYTNTSTLPPKLMAEKTKRPQFFGGLHAYNPIDAMALLEIIVHALQAESCVADATSWAYHIGRTPVVAEISAANAGLFALIFQAIRVVASGKATIAQMDQCMLQGANHRMGPLALADLVGLDITKQIGFYFRTLWDLPGFDEIPMLTEMVTAGHRGVKDLKGFYTYTEKDRARLTQ